jgi:hypothetical protein
MLKECTTQVMKITILTAALFLIIQSAYTSICIAAPEANKGDKNIHDAKTDATIKDIAKFCKTLKQGSAKCEKLRKQFILSIKKKEAIKDPCGPTKVGIKLAKAFPGNEKAKQLALEMSKAKGNIKPEKKAGEKKKKEKKGKKDFVLGEGAPLKCNLKV